MSNNISKWAVYSKEIIEVLQQDESLSDVAVARKILPQLTTREVNLFRTYIKRNKKRLLDKYEGSYEATESLDIDNTTVKHLWVKSKTASLFVKNPNFISDKEKSLDEIDFTSIFKDKITPIEHKDTFTKQSGVDRFIYSDVHIGMEVDKDGFALYEGRWDEEALNQRLDIAINWILTHKKYNTLYISDLGDYMDGWDGMTIRREHSLPQNMDNQKAFDVGLKFKIKMIESLVPYYSKIICNNITDDNHSGAFSYIVNSAFKAYIELKYPAKATINIQRKFIDYYFILDKFCILECHGKDGGTMKFGLKPQINDKVIKLISNFIDENYLSKKGIIIEFDKGDSHQLLIDKSCSKKFQYHNFPSFAPPSNWVKTNFSNSMSGFSFRNYYENGQVSNHDYIF